MRTIEELPLAEAQRRAVEEAERKLKERFPVLQLIVFGPVARGEAVNDSDLVLLVITKGTKGKVSYSTRNLMSDLIFEIKLMYETNLSIVIVNSDSWCGGVLLHTQLYDEVSRDRIPVRSN